MSKTAEKIRGLIQAEGAMPLDAYMTLALNDPDYGYYRTRNPLGRQGDFITAPEISQVFGELIGLWAVDFWQRSGRAELIHFVELGPGARHFNTRRVARRAACAEFLPSRENRVCRDQPRLAPPASGDYGRS